MDTPFKLIKLCLTNKKHYAHKNHTLSTALISTHGVPQGSVKANL